jgi:integrase
MLGMLGLRAAEAQNALIEDLGEEHGHRVLTVLGKGGKKVKIPLPPAVARMIDRAVGERMSGPILLNQIGNAMDGQAQARALKRIAKAGGVRTTRMHPHMLRHTYVTTMLDAGWTFGTRRSQHGTPTRGRRLGTTARGRTWTGTATTSWRRTWRERPRPGVSQAIPPVYTEWIGRQLAHHLTKEAA